MTAKNRKLIFFWLITFFVVLLWSGIKPHDQFTWLLEVLPALIGIVILAATYKYFRFTDLAYWLILIHEVYLKAENLQKTGSFKVRGAFNKMINITSNKVIAASMGNHAQGVAFAANRLGKYAKIIMPLNVPITKEEATRSKDCLKPE